MPPSATVQQTTEVLVMVARQDSAGLAAFLPVEAPDGGVIGKEDVVGHSAEIVFPNPDEPITVWLGVDAPDSDFTIERPFRPLSVRADRDSAFESFFLMPLRAGKRVPVTVSLYGDEAKTNVLGRVRLATNVQADDSAEPATDPLTFGRAPVTIHIGDEITVEKIENSKGVAIGGGASVTVAEAGASGMAPGGIMLFASLHALVAPINPAISPLVEQLRAQALLGDAANDTIVAQLLTAICAAVPATQEVIRVLAEGLGSAVAKPATAAFLETLTAPAPGL